MVRLRSLRDLVPSYITEHRKLNTEHFMPSEHTYYENPLIARYASDRMSRALGPATQVQHMAAAVGCAG